MEGTSIATHPEKFDNDAAIEGAEARGVREFSKDTAVAAAEREGIPTIMSQAPPTAPPENLCRRFALPAGLSFS